MIIQRKYIPPFLTGFGAAVLSTIPEIKGLACCLLVPAAAFLALYMYDKTMNDNSPITLNRALGYGLLTGLTAAFFTTFLDLLITYITHSNDLFKNLPHSEEFLNKFNLGPLMDASLKLIREMAKDVEKTGFSALFTVMILISNFITLSIFGMLGGLVGMSFLNKKNRPKL